MAARLALGARSAEDLGAAVEAQLQPARSQLGGDGVNRRLKTAGFKTFSPEVMAALVAALLGGSDGAAAKPAVAAS